jgi:formylglycine-generating enzyme required for sulfatase activity
MKYIVPLLIVISFLITSCYNSKGTLIGVKTGKIKPPKDMVFVPMGSYINHKIIDGDTIESQSFSVHPFWMSQEVTNKEYRKFVNYIKENPTDSLYWIEFKPEAKLEDSTVLLPRSAYFIHGIQLSEIDAIDTSLFYNSLESDEHRELYGDYFSNPIFDDYPVLGVSVNNAKYYCMWKTKLVNEKAEEEGDYFIPDFRLPTVEEWEFVAQRPETDKKQKKEPQFIVKKVNGKKKKFTNLLPLYPVNSGKMTDYGGYNMKDNVSEWTDYMEKVTEDVQSDYARSPKRTNQIAIKSGGNWNSKPHIYRSSDNSKEANPYTGFRIVQAFLGREYTGGGEF